jgi:hypothetical protein
LDELIDNLFARKSTVIDHAQEHCPPMIATG